MADSSGSLTEFDLTSLRGQAQKSNKVPDIKALAAPYEGC
jgi:hypothetical protein